MQGHRRIEGRRARQLTIACLLLVTAAGLALRCTGVGFMLPHARSPDPAVVSQSIAMRAEATGGGGASEMPLAWGKYPHLVARLAACVPLSEPSARSLDEHLREASAPNRIVRVVVAVLGALAVPGTFLLARPFARRSTALLAAGLVATSLLHVNFSQQARPHAAVATTALYAVLACVLMRRRPGPATYALAGLACALAAGSLHNGLVAIVALLSAHALRERGPRSPGNRLLLLPLLLAGLAIPVFYPFLLEREAFGSASLATGRLAIGEHPPIRLEAFRGGGFARIPTGLWRYDPVLVVFAAAGLVDVLARWARPRPGSDRGRARDLAVVLAFPLAFTLAFGLYSETSPRFLLPLLPYVCALAAAGAMGAARAILSLPVAVRARVPVLALLAALCPGLPSWAAWKLVSARSADDTIRAAAKWVDENVPPEDVVLVSAGLDLPLPSRPDQGAAGEVWQTPWSRYQEERGVPRGARRFEPILDAGRVEGGRDAVLPDSPAAAARLIRSLSGDYAVVEANPRPSERRLALVANVVRAMGELVHRVAPGEMDPRWMAGRGYQYDRSAFRRALGSERWGPVIEIYRLREEGRRGATRSRVLARSP